MPLLNTPNSENQAINTPLSEQKPAKFEKSRLARLSAAVRGCHVVFVVECLSRSPQKAISYSSFQRIAPRGVAGVIPNM